MYLLEIVSMCLIASLCILCTKSDMSEGIIYNKTLMLFLVSAAVINIVYYGFFARDLLYDFLLNLLVIAVVSLYLFYSHSFAGGDCKMTIVVAILYPARYYLVYGRSNITLVFALGFAIFAGYIYLLASSICSIITKKVKITYEYVKNSLLNFLKSYISAMAYIAFMNCILVLCDRWGIFVNVWVSRTICLLVAWCVGRFPVFKKKCLVLPAISVVVVVSVIIKRVPISLNPENYAFVFVLLLCQMTIRTTIYEKMRCEQLRKGMILATLSSVMMQTSITKGLPGVSTEDLRSRLTHEEIESIAIWAKATGTEELTVVKKIPFAIFVSIGFLSYIVLRSIVVWV